MSFQNIFLVGLGGMLGSMARFITVKWIEQRWTSIFPLGTLSVNMVGSFILGMVFSLASRKLGIDPALIIFLGAGFCGGFTTFSAFAIENLGLLQQKPIYALAYIILSTVLGIAAAAAGVAFSKLF